MKLCSCCLCSCEASHGQTNHKRAPSLQCVWGGPQTPLFHIIPPLPEQLEFPERERMFRTWQAGEVGRYIGDVGVPHPTPTWGSIPRRQYWELRPPSTTEGRHAGSTTHQTDLHIHEGCLDNEYANQTPLATPGSFASPTPASSSAVAIGSPTSPLSLIPLAHLGPASQPFPRPSNLLPTIPVLALLFPLPRMLFPCPHLGSCHSFFSA